MRHHEHLLVAQSLSLPLGESMARHTHRQHKLTARWLHEQWNVPDRHDHYLMQIAWLLLLVNSTKETAKDLKMVDRKLKFEPNVPTKPIAVATTPQLPDPVAISQESPERQRLREHATAVSKAAWRARMGKSRTKP